MPTVWPFRWCQCTLRRARECVSAASACIRSSAISTALRLLLSRVTWARPPWWVLSLTAVGWLVMVAHALEHGRHGARHMMPPAAEAQHWLWMVVAMMFPLLGDPL